MREMRLLENFLEAREKKLQWPEAALAAILDALYNGFDLLHP